MAELGPNWMAKLTPCHAGGCGLAGSGLFWIGFYLISRLCPADYATETLIATYRCVTLNGRLPILVHLQVTVPNEILREQPAVAVNDIPVLPYNLRFVNTDFCFISFGI